MSTHLSPPALGPLPWPRPPALPAQLPCRLAAPSLLQPHKDCLLPLAIPSFFLFPDILSAQLFLLSLAPSFSSSSSVDGGRRGLWGPGPQPLSSQPASQSQGARNICSQLHHLLRPPEMPPPLLPPRPLRMGTGSPAAPLHHSCVQAPLPSECGAPEEIKSHLTLTFQGSLLPKGYFSNPHQACFELGRLSFRMAYLPHYATTHSHLSPC